MRLELAKLHNDLKTTMIYVTHDQVEAMTLADKIVVLDKGVISQQGSPLDCTTPRQPLCRLVHRLARDELPARQLCSHCCGPVDRPLCRWREPVPARPRRPRL